MKVFGISLSKIHKATDDSKKRAVATLWDALDETKQHNKDSST